MCYNCKVKNETQIKNWDEAIARVESEISKMEKYVSRLKAAKELYEECRAEGSEWPGSIQAMMDKWTANLEAGTAKKAVPA